MKYLSLAIVLVLATFFSTEAAAQCKSFTKKHCMSNLDSYNSNGQYNGAVIFEGEEATLMQTFYSNQKYRIIVCTQETIAENVYFEVLDYRNQVIYSSQQSESQSFDFSVESTQQLKIRVVSPSAAKGQQLKANGCVSILVGFQNAS